MYKHYYVNKSTLGNPNNNHEVHTDDCPWLPSSSNREYLGYYSNCSDALKKAKTIYANSDGCAICCSSCHHE